VTGTYIWLMLLLKIPIGGMFWILWWVIHQTDDAPIVTEDEGGSKVHGHPTPGPRLPRPRPRRGPHTALPPPAPSRIRGAVTLARGLDCPAAKPQPRRSALLPASLASCEDAK
jgi:hypothetical protein